VHSGIIGTVKTPVALNTTGARDWSGTVWVRSCLHVILEEEWEHHRYAVRDINAIEARADA
jgi:hypothetical protein